MSPSRINIEYLHKRIINSDEKAFKELFTYFYPKLLNYTFVIIKNHETAEDIVLEVFQSIWQSRHKLKSVKKIEHYLYVCARNKTLDYHRKNSRMIQVEFSEPHYHEEIIHSNPEQSMLDAELMEVIDKAIMKLPPKARLIYRMVKEDGLKYHETAEILGISEKTVNNQLLRTMKVIRGQVLRYIKPKEREHYLKKMRLIFLL